jgi:hypothetical protein
MRAFRSYRKGTMHAASTAMGSLLVVRALRRAALLSIVVPAAGCGGNAVPTTGSSACAVQPDASVLLGDDSIEFLPLVGSASTCPTVGEGPFPDSLPQATCEELCPPMAVDGGAKTATGCGVLEVTSPGTEELVADASTAAPGGYLGCCFSPCFTGRRPQGLALLEPAGGDEVGRYLASVAYLEAASVQAFERLTRELAAHGAPSPLRGASRRAARDERRHARLTRDLAEAHGAGLRGVAAQPHTVRNLEEMAAENAAEGCVRETFGAASAMIQAKRAADARVRRAMASIARDETRHAMLAWAVASWLDTKLDARARARVAATRDEAVQTLAREAAKDPHPSVRSLLGVPTAAEARLLIGELGKTLWART